MAMRNAIMKWWQPPPFKEVLDVLVEKSCSKRENALAFLIQEFNKNANMKHIDGFVHKNFATITYYCGNSIKKGSSKEVSLAARFLGLVAFTTIPGDHIAQEILQESMSPISQALKSGSLEMSTCSTLVDCLAVITFLGAVEKPEETEEVFKILGYLITADRTKKNHGIMKSVVHAFSLLLTTKDKVALNQEIWQNSICLLSNVIDRKKDTEVWLVAAQSLALSFEIPSFNRFMRCLEESDGGDFKRDDLKRMVERKVSIYFDSDYLFMFDEVIKFLENNEIPQGTSYCTIKTWGEFLQMKFLKHFLGDTSGSSSFRKETKYIEYASVQNGKFTFKWIDSFVRPLISARMKKTGKRSSLGNKARTRVKRRREVEEEMKANYYTEALGDEEV